MGQLQCGGTDNQDTQSEQQIIKQQSFRNQQINKLSEFKIQSMDFVQLNKETPLFKNYDFENPDDVLGAGAFAEVKVVIHKFTKMKRACKIVKKNMFKKKDYQKMQKELDIMKRLDHPNIVKVIDVYEDSEHIYIITELCTGGELFNRIIEQGNFSEKKAAYFIKQILEGVNFCHSKGIIHRDIKPENILFENEQSEILKIIDFGGSVDQTKVTNIKGKIGTPYYVAPEVLKPDATYSEKCDVWSVGVMLYVLLSGYPPFNGEDDDEILDKVEKGKYDFKGKEWKQISKEAKNFIQKLMEKNPKKRISSFQALQDHWIIKYCNTDISSTVNLSQCLKNIRTFKQDNKLQAAIFTFIVNQLITNQQKSELMQTFKSLDKNSDGVLSRQELIDGFVVQYQGNKEKAIQEVNRILQNNENDYLKYSDWIMATVNKKKLLSMENLEKTFKMLDDDGSGSIDIDEIKNAFKGAGQVSEEVWRELLKEADKDGNGEIDFEEFQILMEKMVEMEEKDNTSNQQQISQNNLQQIKSQNSLKSVRSATPSVFQQKMNYMFKPDEAPIDQEEDDYEDEQEEQHDKINKIFQQNFFKNWNGRDFQQCIC